jgi:hypothetical protein
MFTPSAVLDAKNLDVCCDINCVDGVIETAGNIGNPNKLSSYIYPFAFCGAAPSPFAVLILLYLFTSSMTMSAVLFTAAPIGKPVVEDISVKLLVPLLIARIKFIRKASPLPEPSVLIYIPGLILARV